MSLASMCRTYAQKQTHAIVKDSSGGMTMPSWNDTAYSVGCDVQTKNARVLDQFGQMRMQVVITIFLTGDLGALAGDRVVVNDPQTELVRVFKVQDYGLNSVGYDDWPYVCDVVEERQTP